MQVPIDVPTRESASFIEAHVPRGTVILEVGCGAGDVALELVARGFRATGLDTDVKVVRTARERGAPVAHATWPAFDGGSVGVGNVDAVVFTRSLHHIPPLAEAIARARNAVGPTGGALLVEDFSVERADQRTIDWFLGVLRSRTARTLVSPIAGELVTELLASERPMAVWRRSHDPEFHPVEAMIGAIAEHFDMQHTASVPYLYRYLVPVLPETPDAAAFVEQVLVEETRLGGLGEIALVGCRIVAISAGA